ncbi:MAG: helix-turn-helix domain-containing protein [Clostridia bacterium]|nr:helix-turn-helix domain-containing protein [Clostridia bacterium]
MDMTNFKNNLKDLRLEKGVKQKEVAKHCDISPQCISQLELGTRNPTGTTLLALADYFNCSVDYLLGRTEDFSSPKSSNEPTSAQEKELLIALRSLPTELQSHLVKHIKKLAKIYKK